MAAVLHEPCGCWPDSLSPSAPALRSCSFMHERRLCQHAVAHLLLCDVGVEDAVKGEGVLLAVTQERQRGLAWQAPGCGLLVGLDPAEHADLQQPGGTGRLSAMQVVSSTPCHSRPLLEWHVSAAMPTAGCRMLHQCTTSCCFTHVAPELHQLVVQLPALGLRCRCCILQVGHLGQQLVDHVTVLSVTQHLLEGAELTCSSACNSWW